MLSRGRYRVKKVGLATALQNFGRFADGFPEVPSFENMTHVDKIQTSLDTARNHVQNVFSFASQENEADLNLENALSADDEMWDTPYGLDGAPDINNTTAHQDHVSELSHNYAVETLGTKPDFDTTSGHLDSDIVNKGGTIKGGNATNDGNAIVEKRKAEQAFTSIYMNQLLREQTRDQTRFMLEQLKETREFLANMSDADLDTNNTSAESVAKREKLRLYLEEQDLDINDYIKEDGHIDRERMDKDLEARKAQYEANEVSVEVSNATNAVEIESGKKNNPLRATEQPSTTVAFNNSCANSSVECTSESELKQDKYPNALLFTGDSMFASIMGGDTSFLAENSAEETSISTDDKAVLVSSNEITASEEGHETASSIETSDRDYESISVAEAVTATDQQPQEVSLLPLGEWKTMEISSAFQEQSFATVDTLAQAANQTVYDSEDTYDNTDPAAVAGMKVA